MSTLIDSLRKEIARLEAKIKEIQDECNHPRSALLSKGGSNTGNWCKQDDSYWTDYHCQLCDKRWTKYHED